MVDDPVRAFTAAHDDNADAELGATLAIATIRGLTLDLLTTGDRDRVGAAADAFIAMVAPNTRAPGSP